MIHLAAGMFILALTTLTLTVISLFTAVDNVSAMFACGSAIATASSAVLVAVVWVLGL